MRQLFFAAMVVLLNLACSHTNLVSQVDPAVRKAEQQRVAAIAKAKKSAVSVFAPGGGGGGSGVLISKKGFALTNYHVVKPCGTYMQCSLPDGNLYDAVLVGVDPVGDVAIIQLLGREDFPAATLADSDKVRAGDWCFAVGNPFLLATDFQPTVTWGIVSGVNRYQYPAKTLLEYADCIQTDAAINPGNSGGPLFDANGDVIGINGRGSFEKRGRINVGVGYAISINQIKYFMDHLMSGRIVDHATLGATVFTDDQGRVIVDAILESSDAYQKGLRFEDEIVRFGGRQIDTVNQFKNVLGIYPKGWRVPLTFRREGKNYDIVVRLSGVHDAEQLTEMIQGKARPAAKPSTPKNKKGGKKAKRAPGGGIPQVAKDRIEARRGYANYYYNRLRRTEIWNGDSARQKYDQNVTGKWVIKARASDGTAVEIVLDEEKSGIQWGDDPYVLDPEKDLSEQLFPRQTGGLLPALHIWRRMLVMGPEKFGSVHYFGSIPFQGFDQNPHVFEGTYNVAETNFMFDRETYQLRAMEMFLDPEGNAVEVNFGDFESVNGSQLPKSITTIVSGKRIKIRFLSFQVEESKK